MTMVITGVAGFIGSHLADRLLADGHQVIGIDNLSRGQRAHIAEASQHPDFRFVEADLADPAAPQGPLLELFAASAPLETVWHLAANSDIAAGVADAGIDLRDTFLTTFNTVELAKRCGAKSIAFASSSAVYGIHQGPMTETTGPLLPISGYGAMKLAAEAIISAAVESHFERAWIYRFPNVVGDRATHGVINDLFLKLGGDRTQLQVLGDGKQRKPYLHVSEVVDAMIYIHANGGDETRQIFNIGPNDDGFDVAGIAQAVVAASGTGARIQYTGGDRGWVGDVPRFSYSVEKLNQLGWRASMSSGEAVARAVGEIALERGFS